MSDELRQYPPTPRHLERLRRSGLTPGSPALAAVAVLAGAGAAVWLAGGSLSRWLQGVVAQDLQRGLMDPAQLPALLGLRLGQAILPVVVVGLGAGALAVLAGMAQGNVPQRLSKPLVLPMSGDSRGGRRRSLVSSLLPGAIACGGAVWLTADWVRRLGEQPAWPAPQAGPVSALWLRWLAVLAVAGAVHAVAAAAEYARRARMTHREMLEDRRETEGSWLTRRRRHQRLRRRG